MVTFSKVFLTEARDLLGVLASAESVTLEAMATEIFQTRQAGGRLYVCGLGGSAATASHAVNDLRKLCDVDARCPTDNVAEMTARANDAGWSKFIVDALTHDRPRAGADRVLFLSVGGGDQIRSVSIPLVQAAQFAADVGVRTLAILGRTGGDLANIVDLPLVIPDDYPERVTPHVEGLTSVLLHCLVSHPTLKRNPTKW